MEKKRKASDNWKILSFFESMWSEEYQGAVYGRSGRDFKATKVFLELYPDFFDDEILQSTAKQWFGKYLKSKFWYQPSGSPPLYHPFWAFVEHLDKYQVAQKKFDVIKKGIVTDLPRPASKENVHKYVEEFKKSVGR